MDVVKMVEVLREERARLEEANRSTGTDSARAGKAPWPPAWMTAMGKTGSRPGRPPGSKNKVKMNTAG
jgi:hypothetical protein